MIPSGALLSNQNVLSKKVEPYLEQSYKFLSDISNFLP